MKTTTTPLSSTFDGEGFPIPEPLAEEIMDPDGRIEDAVVRRRGAAMAALAGPAAADTGTGAVQIAPELFGPPVGWDDMRATPPDTRATTTPIPAPPAASSAIPPDPGLSLAEYQPGGIFAAPESLFGPGLTARDLNAPDTPPIGVDDAVFAAKGAAPDDPFGTRPLVAVVPDDEDTTNTSSTPRWMRDVRLDHSICRGCKHGWERLHAMPATSRSRVFFKYAINCTAFGREPYDVTSATVFSCSRFKASGKRVVKPVQMMVEEARARVQAEPVGVGLPE